MGEDMVVIETVYAAILLPLGITITYLFHRILINFRRHQEISMVMFFLNEDTPRTFQIISITVFLYAIAIFLRLLSSLDVSVGVLFIYLDIASKLMSILALLATIQFQRGILRVTTKPSDQ